MNAIAPAEGVPEVRPETPVSIPPPHHAAGTSGSPGNLHAPHAEKGVSGRDWIGFMSMVVGMFMAILDIQIVASSLSEIQAGVSAGADEISWVQTAYLIAEVIMIPLSGWLARLLSTRWLFLASCVTFTAMSGLCAFAWDINSMIVFRALQGFLGGAMIPTVFASSFMIFPQRLRTRVSVMVGLTATLAPTIGPTLGGWLTQSLSWHWLFLINVVPGIIVGILVFTYVRIDKPRPEMLSGFDWQGIVFVAMFLGCLEYVLEEGPRNDWFEDGTITALAVISALGFVLLLWRELTAKKPVVDLKAFKNRNFLFGSMFSFIIGTGLYGSVYLVPLFLGRVRGYDPLQIGLIMMVTGIFQVASAPIAANLIKRIDARLVLAFGLAGMGLALYLNSLMTSDWAYWDLFLPQAVRGFSMMLCMLPVNQLALGMLPREEVQNASGLYNLMRNLGGAIGLAVINTVINDRSKLHIQRLADLVTSARDQVNGQIDALTDYFTPSLGGGADLAAMKLIAQRLSSQALVLTYSDVLILMSSVFVFALALMPMVRKVPMGGGGEAH